VLPAAAVPASNPTTANKQQHNKDNNIQKNHQANSSFIDNMADMLL
jgi:hypothetical protein